MMKQNTSKQLAVAAMVVAGALSQANTQANAFQMNEVTGLNPNQVLQVAEKCGSGACGGKEQAAKESTHKCGSKTEAEHKCGKKHTVKESKRVHTSKAKADHKCGSNAAKTQETHKCASKETSPTVH